MKNIETSSKLLFEKSSIIELNDNSLHQINGGSADGAAEVASAIVEGIFDALEYVNDAGVAVGGMLSRLMDW